MRSRVRKQNIGAMKASLFVAARRWDQKWQYNPCVHDPREENKSLVAEAPCTSASVRARGKELLTLWNHQRAMYSSGRKRITCAIEATLLMASVGLD